MEGERVAPAESAVGALMLARVITKSPHVTPWDAAARAILAGASPGEVSRMLDPVAGRYFAALLPHIRSSGRPLSEEAAANAAMQCARALEPLSEGRDDAYRSAHRYHRVLRSTRHHTQEKERGPSMDYPVRVPWARAVDCARETLAMLRATDHGPAGVTDAGFKAVVLAALNRIFPQGTGWRIESHMQCGPQRAASIGMTHRALKLAVLVDLGYVRACELAERGAVGLDEVAAQVPADEQALLVQRVEASCHSIRYLLGATLEQACSMRDAFAADNGPAWGVYCCALIGVAGRVVCRLLLPGELPAAVDMDEFQEALLDGE